MKLLLQSLIIFFGTLLAAGVVALGEPRQEAVVTTQSLPAHTSTVAAAR